MARMFNCKGCGATDEGTEIYQCSGKARHIFCSVCKPSKGILNVFCPRCDTVGRQLGKIPGRRN